MDDIPYRSKMKVDQRVIMVKENTTPLNKNTVLLISGGAKGITSQCAIKIAETAHCRFILIGRSPILESEPVYAKDSKSSKELQDNALKSYKKKGEKITPKVLQKEIKEILSSREIS